MESPGENTDEFNSRGSPTPLEIILRNFTDSGDTEMVDRDVEEKDRGNQANTTTDEKDTVENADVQAEKEISGSSAGIAVNENVLPENEIAGSSIPTNEKGTAEDVNTVPEVEMPDSRNEAEQQIWLYEVQWPSDSDVGGWVEFEKEVWSQSFESLRHLPSGLTVCSVFHGTSKTAALRQAQNEGGCSQPLQPHHGLCLRATFTSIGRPTNMDEVAKTIGPDYKVLSFPPSTTTPNKQDTAENENALPEGDRAGPKDTTEPQIWFYEVHWPCNANSEGWIEIEKENWGEAFSSRLPPGLKVCSVFYGAPKTAARCERMLKRASNPLLQPEYGLPLKLKARFISMGSWMDLDAFAATIGPNYRFRSRLMTGQELQQWLSWMWQFLGQD